MTPAPRPRQASPEPSHDRRDTLPYRPMITAGEVEGEIMRLSQAMDTGLEDLEQRAKEAAGAEHAYKVAFAKARLVARDEPGHGPKERTTDAEADDKATVRCDDELRKRLITDALHGVTQESLRTMRSQIDALRTIAANIRAQS